MSCDIAFDKTLNYTLINLYGKPLTYTAVNDISQH